MIDDFVYYTHPDNVAALRASIDNASEDWRNRGLFEIRLPPSWSTEIRENPLLDKDKPTGRYVMPDGKVVERDKVRIVEKYWEYGPEDIGFLLYAGLIREQRETLVVKVARPSFFRAGLLDLGPMLPKMRAIVSGFAW